MGSHITKPSNKSMVDRLVEHHSYIHTPSVEGVFRAVDRAMYFELEEDETIDPYDDDPWRRGNLHLSAPCIYAKVVEALDLRPGLSFLNLGSGTGYLNTIVGLLVGPNGINHGIEFHEEVVNYANKRLEQFKQKSYAIDKYDFSEPIFVKGNCLNINPESRYDRIYLGAACLPDLEMFMKKLVKPSGGILVMPYDNHLMRYVRTGELEWRSEKLMDVNFTLMIGQSSDNEPLINLPLSQAKSLKELCRISIRQQLRDKTNSMNPNLLHSDNINSRRLRKAKAEREMLLGRLQREGSDSPPILHRARRDRGLTRLGAASASLRRAMMLDNSDDDIGNDDGHESNNECCIRCQRKIDAGNNQLVVNLPLPPALGESSTRGIQVDSTRPSTSSLGGVMTRSASRRLDSQLGKRVDRQDKRSTTSSKDIGSQTTNEHGATNRVTLNLSDISSSCGDASRSDEDEAEDNNDKRESSSHQRDFGSDCARTRPFVYTSRNKPARPPDRAFGPPPTLTPVRRQRTAYLHNTSSSSSSSSLTSTSSSSSPSSSSSDDEFSSSSFSDLPANEEYDYIGRQVVLNWSSFLGLRRREHADLEHFNHRDLSDSGSSSSNSTELILDGNDVDDYLSDTSWDSFFGSVSVRHETNNNEISDELSLTGSSHLQLEEDNTGLDGDHTQDSLLNDNDRVSRALRGSSRLTISASGCCPATHLHASTSMTIASQAHQEEDQSSCIRPSSGYQTTRIPAPVSDSQPQQQQEPVARRLRSKRPMIGMTSDSLSAATFSSSSGNISLFDTNDSRPTMVASQPLDRPTPSCSRALEARTRHNPDCPRYKSNHCHHQRRRRHHHHHHHHHHHNHRSNMSRHSLATDSSVASNQASSEHSEMHLSSAQSSTGANLNTSTSTSGSSSAAATTAAAAATRQHSMLNGQVLITGLGTTLYLPSAHRNGSLRLFDRHSMGSMEPNASSLQFTSHRRHQTCAHHHHLQQLDRKRKRHHSSSDSSEISSASSPSRQRHHQLASPLGQHHCPSSSLAASATGSARRRCGCAASGANTAPPPAPSQQQGPATGTSSYCCRCVNTSSQSNGSRANNRRLLATPSRAGAQTVSSTPARPARRTSRIVSSLHNNDDCKRSSRFNRATLVERLHRRADNEDSNNNNNNLNSRATQVVSSLHQLRNHNRSSQVADGNSQPTSASSSSCNRPRCILRRGHRRCHHRHLTGSSNTQVADALDCGRLEEIECLRQRQQRQRRHRHRQQERQRRMRNSKRRRENECERYHNHMSGYIRQLPLPRVLHGYLNYDRNL